MLAGRGDLEEAERLGRKAVAVADSTDFLHLRPHTRISLAQVLGQIGSGRDPAPVLREALALAELKGSVVGARSARALLEGAKFSRAP